VTQRSSLGVATLIASERFDTNAQQLATLAVFQLIVYAGMQIPVGILLDRFGAKILLAVGALIMAVGQIVLAFAPVLSFAVVGRMLVGMGDSFTFISMIAMINGWYQGTKASTLQQYVASGGQLGQFLSAVPFWWLLNLVGWTPAFTVMSAISLVTVALLVTLTADTASGKDKNSHKVVSLKIATAQLVENIKHPGVRLAFWTHFVTQPTTTSVMLLWAVPFIVTAQGQSHEFASLTLSAMVFFGFITGPIIGGLCAKRPQTRALIVYLTVLAIALVWVFICLQSEPLPAWLLLICFLVISVGGPASMIAFDFSKDMVPKSKLGSANGFANVGGFLATFVMMYLTGLAIDLVQAATGNAERYTVQGFQLGFATQLLVVGLGVTFFTVERRKYLRMSSEIGNN
jgi:MFS family permease